MGRICKEFDPLKNPPRNVRDISGQITAFYFPSSNKLRFLDGEMVEVNTSGKCVRHKGDERVLDLEALILHSIKHN